MQTGCPSLLEDAASSSEDVSLCELGLLAFASPSLGFSMSQILLSHMYKRAFAIVMHLRLAPRGNFARERLKASV